MQVYSKEADRIKAERLCFSPVPDSASDKKSDENGSNDIREPMGIEKDPMSTTTNGQGVKDPSGLWIKCN